MSYYTRKLFLGTLGIYFSYISISYLAQKLFNTDFRTENAKLTHEKYEKFAYPSLVTWVGCLLCSIYGLVYAKYYDDKPNLIALKQKLRLGLLFTLNYLPTNYSLLYVSYPLQVVAKNTRYILVVIVGVFFSRVEKSKQLKLPLSKLFIGTFISLGAGLFMYFQASKEAKKFHLDPLKRWIGYFLLLIAVVSDAFFSDSQAYCKANFKPTPNQLFLASNLYGFVFIFVFSFFSGELFTSISFCLKHPFVIVQLLMIGSLQVLGQVSVYYVISHFKQHIYPLISTTRKIITILVSIVVFNHKLNSSQWASLVIVFVSMAYELYDQIQSQEYHRQVRKKRLQKSHMEESEAQESSKLAESQYDLDYKVQDLKESEIKANQQKGSLIKQRSMRGSRSSQVERLNRFIAQQILKRNGKSDEQSLSKYRYNWRIGEVVEDRETSLTPIKKVSNI